jgi:hypothetical protein
LQEIFRHQPTGTADNAYGKRDCTGAGRAHHPHVLVLRRHRVIIDADLAALYGVTTKRFNEQVRRNRNRFPADFMFQLTLDEHTALRSHFATSNTMS